MIATGSDTAEVLVGCSGWSYDDWNGVFYPADAPSRFDRLAWMARFFDATEVNATFYRILPGRATASWVRRTPERFRFTAKLHRDFTHSRPLEAANREIVAFHDCVRPLVEADRFAGLLVQFPWSFKDEPESRDHLKRLAEAFRDLDPFLEVRHESWLKNDAPEFVLREGFCPVNIDQPVIGRSIGLTDRHDNRRAYYRLHGRNYKNWFAKNEDASDTDRRNARYDYLYNDEEIDRIVGHIDTLLDKVKQVLVFTNNHYEAQAAANALQIVQKFKRSKAPIPEMLIEQYPFLESIAEREDDEPGRQGELF